MMLKTFFAFRHLNIQMDCLHQSKSQIRDLRLASYEMVSIKKYDFEIKMVQCLIISRLTPMAMNIQLPHNAGSNNKKKVGT